jgi:hypothetical protein
VRFIARGAHLQALTERGLRVRTVKGDFQVQVPATDDPAGVGPCDFVLLCVRTFDTDADGAAAVKRLLAPVTGARRPVRVQDVGPWEALTARASREPSVEPSSADTGLHEAESGVRILEFTKHPAASSHIGRRQESRSHRGFSIVEISERKSRRQVLNCAGDVLSSRNRAA